MSEVQRDRGVAMERELGRNAAKLVPKPSLRRWKGAKARHEPTRHSIPVITRST